MATRTPVPGTANRLDVGLLGRAEQQQTLRMTPRIRMVLDPSQLRAQIALPKPELPLDNGGDPGKGR